MSIDLDSIFKSRDITLPTKVRLVKAMVFPVVMYGCLQCSCLENPRDGGAWQHVEEGLVLVLTEGCCQGGKESDTTEQLN